MIPRLAKFEGFFDEENVDVVQIADAEIVRVESLETKLIPDREAEMKMTMLPPVLGILSEVAAYLGGNGLQQFSQQAESGCFNFGRNRSVGFGYRHITFTCLRRHGSDSATHEVLSCGGMGANFGAFLGLTGRTGQGGGGGSGMKRLGEDGGGTN